MTDVEPTTQEPAPTGEPTTQEPATNWQDAFSADMRSNPSFLKFADGAKDATEFGAKTFKSYVDLQAALGKDKVSIPGKDAKPEEWDLVFNRLGRPEKIEGYELSEWQAPEGVPWNPDVTTRMVERMHAHRLTKDQAHGILNDYAQMQAEVWNDHISGVERANEQTVSDLRSKWGAAYAGKMESAKRAAIEIFGPAGEDGTLFDVLRLEDGRLLGDHPAIIEAFSMIGERMAEDGAPSSIAKRTTLTRDEAQRKLNEMHGDVQKWKILNDPSHPEHKHLQSVRSDLMAQVYNA